MRAMPLIVSLVLLLVGCASPIKSLTDPAGAQMVEDMAPLGAVTKLPYEFKNGRLVTVGLNLRYAETSSTSGYIATIFMKNNTKERLEVAPRVTLEEGSGLVREPYTFAAFMQHAARLAGVQIPASLQQQPQSVEHRGTVRDISTGRTYSYSGSTSSGQGGGFLGGLLAGLADAEVANASAAKKEGGTLLRWADAHWMKDRYRLESGQAVAAVLVYPRRGIGHLPLTFRVNVDDEIFVFRSITVP